ncbi:MAG TPA: hypothetical protein VF761_16655 [Gemmatimonadaceae bacterium]
MPDDATPNLNPYADPVSGLVFRLPDEEVIRALEEHQREIRRRAYEAAGVIVAVRLRTAD